MSQMVKSLLAITMTRGPYDKPAQAFYELGAAKKVKFGDLDCIYGKSMQ